MKDNVRLIDANVLMDSVQRKKSGVADKRFVEGFNDATARVRSMIHSAPTIDAVPVVRCRDCKKRGHDWECPLCWMEWFENEHIEGHFEKHDETEDDGFCHKGAKMDGGAERC